MEIKLNKPHQFLDVNLALVAFEADCYLNLKWWMPHGARFTLHISHTDHAPASFEQHDAVILSLLTIYPDARIRTARATFEGLADWEAQKQARVA